jgi:hypothetical protein
MLLIAYDFGRSMVLQAAPNRLNGYAIIRVLHLQFGVREQGRDDAQPSSQFGREISGIHCPYAYW